MNEIIEKSNSKLHKERAERFKKEIENMIRSFLNKCPKDILIEVLLKRKIIERNWEKDGIKYNLKEKYNV